MQMLGLSGYRTRAVGKMHFRPVRRHFGFHEMELMEEIPDFREEDAYLTYLKENGTGHVREVHGVRNLLYHLPQVSVIPEAHHGSTWVADPRARSCQASGKTVAPSSRVSAPVRLRSSASRVGFAWSEIITPFTISGG